MITTTGTATSGGVASETAVRQRLQVPPDAPQVMVVNESTHWDPNWLCTSAEYFRWRVRRCLDQAIDALVAEPRRVFSLECVFFPDLYWDQRPERRTLFRSLVNEGRLRLTGSGVTTPDTLLPEDEMLLRDLLIGQEWLRTRGMTQEPRILYLPDSFGHTPGLPSLLRAAGLSGVAVTRIDGMRFPGADMESADGFPRPGTSAEHLLAEQTADFVWRGPDGSEVLAHWMTYGYGHGDMIASGGLSRVLGLPTSWPDRRHRHVTARIDGYVEQLNRVARTPYLLLAMGSDFVAPVPHLVDLLDRWNDQEYERTGVWLVSAGLDDYLDLVAHHRNLLPTLHLDPNPYWMGFYATRPDIKVRCRTLGRQLVDVDNERARETVDPELQRDGSLPTARHARAWWRAVSSNHHDYITGTSPDRIANGEQTRWLDEAFVDLASGSRSRASTQDDRRKVVPPGDAAADEQASWARQGHLVTVRSSGLTAVFDERRGGTLVELTNQDGDEHLVAPSLELRSYAETGGLWRMGQEFHGGRWSLADRSSEHPAEVRARSDDQGGVRIEVRASLERRPVELSVAFGRGDPHLLVRTSLAAPRRRTVTLAVHRSGPTSGLLMHQPGGMVARELQRWYDPTFWPLHSFAAALSSGPGGCDGSVAVVATAVPTALHADPTGMLETVVARTATKELAFGAIPVLAPAWGFRWGTQCATVAWTWRTAGDSSAVSTLGRRLQDHVDRSVGRPIPEWIIETGDPLVEVIAVKVADRGEGVVVRLRSWTDTGSARAVPLRLARDIEDHGATITDAWQVDSCERDLSPILVRDGAAHPVIDSHLTTIRLALRGVHTASPADRTGARTR